MKYMIGQRIKLYGADYYITNLPDMDGRIEVTDSSGHRENVLQSDLDRENQEGR